MFTVYVSKINWDSCTYACSSWDDVFFLLNMLEANEFVNKYSVLSNGQEYLYEKYLKLVPYKVWQKLV